MNITKGATIHNKSQLAPLLSTVLQIRGGGEGMASFVILGNLLEFQRSSVCSPVCLFFLNIHIFPFLLDVTCMNKNAHFNITCN